MFLVSIVVIPDLTPGALTWSDTAGEVGGDKIEAGLLCLPSTLDLVPLQRAAFIIGRIL